MNTPTAVTTLERALRLARAAGSDVVVSVDTAQGVLDLLAEVCDAHATCVCGNVFCRDCGLGEPVDCAAGALEVHCLDCLDTCGPCLDEAVREFHAEQAEDTRRFGAV